MKTVPDWSSLPNDAIEFISSRLATGLDYACFRSVCNSWRLASPRRQQLPWVLVEHYIDDKPDNFVLELCDFPTGELLRPQLPYKGRIRRKIICGSCRGWIIFLHATSVICLYNPITRVDILLPTRPYLVGIPHKRFSKWANKVILSSDPSGADCVVMAICFDWSRLMFCRPRDDSWNLMSLPSEESYFDDIISYNSLFYAVRGYKVFVCDTGEDATVTEIIPASPLFSDNSPRHENVDRVRKSYLVVSSGDLLIVTLRTINDDYDLCEVFRVDFNNGLIRLFKLENLGGGALFLDDISMSVHAGNSPWCRANCIYLTRLKIIIPPFDDSDSEHDDSYSEHVNTVIKAFNVEDGRWSSTLLGVSDGVFHWLTPSVLY